MPNFRKTAARRARKAEMKHKTNPQEHMEKSVQEKQMDWLRELQAAICRNDHRLIRTIAHALLYSAEEADPGGKPL